MKLVDWKENRLIGYVTFIDPIISDQVMTDYRGP
jgi:hypothetical protein